MFKCGNIVIEQDRYPGSTDTFESNGQVYHIGDFVYIEPRYFSSYGLAVCILWSIEY